MGTGWYDRSARVGSIKQFPRSPSSSSRAYPHGIVNGAYAMPFNLSGHPAVVIPIGQTKDGLPIGIQIIGQRWKEMECWAIAQQIDAVIGGFWSLSGY